MATKLLTDEAMAGDFDNCHGDSLRFLLGQRMRSLENERGE